MKKTVDVLVSFDTTGSMASVLGAVRKNVEKTVRYLFQQIPDLRIGIIGHGDYCDGKNVLTLLELSTEEEKICKFIRNVPATSGGDVDECYEFVLNTARSVNWTSGNNKCLVMIGDAEPHKVGYKYRGVTNKLDWKNELKLLLEAGVKVYPIHALPEYYQTRSFWQNMADISGVEKLDLEQFSDINDIILALTMHRAGKLAEFETTIVKRGGVSYSVMKAVDSLAGRKTKARKTSSHAADAVPPWRFQLLDVDEDTPIKEFVQDNGLVFKQGRGFYEFTKPVVIQDYKEIVIQDRDTGEMFTGPKAREILGIPTHTAKCRPEILRKYRGFVQSTSPNRKLLGGTKFLYEVSK